MGKIINSYLCNVNLQIIFPVFITNFILNFSWHIELGKAYI
jgi:hypothetical protein